MKNPLSIIGAVVLGVLVSGSSEVISLTTPTRNLSAQTASAGAEELSGTGNPWLNVRTFGAQGDGLADDTAAIQKAIDEAKARKGSVVFFPSGIYVISQVILRQGISLMGSGINLPGNGLGTILQQ